MTGRWMMAAIQTTFAVMPALVYLFAGWTISRGSDAITIGTLVAFTTLQTRLFFPIGSLLGVQLEVQSSLALFDRIFEYLDQPVDIVEGTQAIERPRGDVAFDEVWFGYEAGRVDARGRHRSSSPRARRRRSSARRARARRPAPTSSPASTTRRRGSVTIDGVDVRELTFAVARRRGRRRLAGDVPLPRERPREPPLREAGRDGRRGRGGRAAPRRSTTSSPRCRRATRRSSASAGTGSRAARSSASRSRGRSCATRRSSCSTRRPRRSTRRPSARCRRARAPRRGPNGDRDRPSPLDGPRRRPDRRARPAAASSSAGRTTSCSRSAAATRRSSPATPTSARSCRRRAEVRRLGAVGLVVGRHRRGRDGCARAEGGRPRRRRPRGRWPTSSVASGDPGRARPRADDGDESPSSSREGDASVGDRFRVGSVTKTFVAALALTLADERPSESRRSGRPSRLRPAARRRPHRRPRSPRPHGGALRLHVVRELRERRALAARPRRPDEHPGSPTPVPLFEHRLLALRATSVEAAPAVARRAPAETSSPGLRLEEHVVRAGPVRGPYLHGHERALPRRHRNGAAARRPRRRTARSAWAAGAVVSTGGRPRALSSPRPRWQATSVGG